MPDESEMTGFYERDYTKVHHQKQGQDSNVLYYQSHAEELNGLAGREGGLRIADIGCSIPVFLREAKKRGAQYCVGVDLAVDARVFGRRWGIEMVEPDEFDSVVEDGSLDVLRYSHVLEHFANPKIILHSHLKKLRHDGLLYITQPNFPTFCVDRTTLDLHDSVWPTHLQFFNPLSCIYLCGAQIKIEKFFSLTDETLAFEKYKPIMDIPYAAEHLSELRSRGESIRGHLNGWPFYTGLNMALYGRYQSVDD